MTTTMMRIGELALRAGVNVQTVRYYERRGLLHDPRRRSAGYREYTDTTLDRLRFIKRAQELGFTLTEITELLALRVNPGTTAADVKQRATMKVAEIEGKLRDLERIRHALAHLAGQCRGGHGPVGECPLLDALGSVGADDHSARASRDGSRPRRRRRPASPSGRDCGERRYRSA